MPPAPSSTEEENNTDELAGTDVTMSPAASPLPVRSRVVHGVVGASTLEGATPVTEVTAAAAGRAGARPAAPTASTTSTTSSRMVRTIPPMVLDPYAPSLSQDVKG